MTGDPRILIVSHIGAGPPYEGNRARMAMLLDAIRAFGYSVHFAGVDMSPAEQAGLQSRIDHWVDNFTSVRLQCRPVMLGPRIRWRLAKLRLLKYSGPRDLPALDSAVDVRWVERLRHIQAQAHYPRVLVAYVFHSAFLTAFGPDCLKILDTHDIFGDRRARLEASGLTNNWFSLTVADERQGLLRADRILAIQDAEQRYFESLIGGQRMVRTVGHITPNGYLEHAPASLNRISYLGSRNTLNVESLTWFLDRCWPQIVAARPTTRLLIGGNICGTLGAVPAGVDLAGEVPDPAAFHAQALFSVNPMRGGTGLKIKSVEALAAGRALVTFESGAAGLGALIGTGVVVAVTPDQFTADCLALLGDVARAVALGQALPARLAVLNEQWRDDLRQTLERADPGVMAE